MGKGLHKVFKTVVKEFLLHTREWERTARLGLEHVIPEPRNFAEVTKLSDDIKKPWLKATIKGIDNLIDNQTFLVEYPKKDEHMTPCMDVYKSKIQYDRNLDKLKLRILVRGYLHNKELVGETWSPTASI